MFSLVAGIFVAGLLALASSALLFARYRFERFVGVRYLRRGRTSRAVRAGLWLSVLVTAAGLAMFLLARGGQSRGFETAGVVTTLAGGLALEVFVLLRMLSVFTTVSTMGVVLGVASLVVVLAVTSGFEREFKNRVLAMHAHLIATNVYLERDMVEAEKEVEEVRPKLKSLPGLTKMTKFSFSQGEVMIGKVGANLKGVDLSDGAPELARARLSGEVAALARPAYCTDAGPGGDEAGRMFVGSELARRLRVKVGECVQVLVPFSRGLSSPPSAQAFKVVGVFHLGFYEYDARLAFIPLEDARRLGNARLSLFGLELRFDDPDKAMALEAEVENRLGPGWRILHWRALNQNLFTALNMQKLIIALILVLIIVVAAFNIIASLTLIVLSKVREIAILGSMGARAGSLLRIFIVAGSFVGFVGTGLGILFGLAVCGLARLYGYALDPKVYLINELPVDVSVRELLFVAAATQLICFLATIYPAVRAARLRVLDGLRFT